MSMVLLALGCPFLFYIAYLYCTKPWTGFVLTLVFDYVIMGATRYVPLPFPVSVLIEAVHLFLLVILIANRDDQVEEGKIPMAFIGIYSIWTFYCCAEIINDTCSLGLDMVAWFKDVRFYAFDPLICILIFAVAINNKKDTQKVLTVIGVIMILAGIKCFWQKTFGFDAAERAWLESGPARTHIIRAGTLIRYFSFFTDAANYGSHTAMMAAVFGVQTLFVPTTQWKRKLFYITVTLACLYGMFMSGARTAFYVLVGTLVAYTVLSRNWRMFGLTMASLMFFVGVLLFTDRGNGIDAVRRMRSGLNLNDASVQVRDTNKEAISKYMGEAPLGIGLGRSRENVPEYNRYRVVVETPPDSTLVRLWTLTGIVGVSLFCFVSFLILFRCSTIIWFKLKDPELRTTCATFTAAGAGWFAAGYANEVYFQYPNPLIVFGMLTIVFMAPYLEQKTEQENEQKALEEQACEELTD